MSQPTAGGDQPKVPQDEQSLAAKAAGITAAEVASSLVSGAVGAAVGMVATPIVGAAAAVATGAAIRVGSELGGQMVDAASRAASEIGDAISGAASEAGAAISSALGLGDTTPTPAPAASAPKPSAVGVATVEHVVAPTAAALVASSDVLRSAGHTLASARSGIIAPPPSPEIQTKAEEITKTAENTDIGLAAHEAVKVDPKAPEAFIKIRALLRDAGKTNDEKLKEIGEIEGIGAIDDSSFKVFLGIAQASLGMSDSKAPDGKTSEDASKFLTALSDNFFPIFAPPPGGSRGGAEEMNAAFAACGKALQEGVGKLPAMQSAVETNFKSGFQEAIDATAVAQKEAASKEAVSASPSATKAAVPAAKAEEKLSLKEVGKDSLKIAGSIALSLLVPGGFLVAMAACYILRDKDRGKEVGEPEIDVGLHSGVERVSRVVGATPPTPTTSHTAVSSVAAAPAAAVAPPVSSSVGSPTPGVVAPPVVAFKAPPSPSSPVPSPPPVAAGGAVIAEAKSGPQRLNRDERVSVMKEEPVLLFGMDQAVKEAMAAGVGSSAVAGLTVSDAKAGSLASGVATEVGRGDEGRAV